VLKFTLLKDIFNYILLKYAKIYLKGKKLTFKEKRKSPINFIIVLILLFCVIGGGYLYLSPAFEQEKPVIKAPSSVYWNLKSKLPITLQDQSGIKYYKITFKNSQRTIILDKKILNTIQKTITINVTPPKLDMFYNGKDTTIQIEAIDNSKWNFLDGNKATKIIKVFIDTQKPIATVIENSRYIQRGGSAVAIVKVQDDNLQDAYITFNNTKKFKLIPYHKKDYYAALIAWPIDFEHFKRVNLIAIDKANNKTITKIPFYVQKKIIKYDKIKLTKDFITNVSANVLKQSFEEVPKDLKDIFIYSNSTLREKNIKTIQEVALKAIDDTMVTDFFVHPFKRLRGSKTVANYASRRFYYLDGKKINEAWHLGIDWASVKKAPIKVSNDGVVIFKDYLGLYGNTIIINHGLGLASLYAHTSSQDVNINDFVTAGQKIANTGATGAVFGDHLHFGILIQGVEVNPREWMDKNWMKRRIFDVLSKAKKDINGK